MSTIPTSPVSLGHLVVLFKPSKDGWACNLVGLIPSTSHQRAAQLLAAAEALPCCPRCPHFNCRPLPHRRTHDPAARCTAAGIAQAAVLICGWDGWSALRLLPAHALHSRTTAEYFAPVTPLLPAVGVALFTFNNVSTTCYDSAQQLRADTGGSSGGGGGTPGWVWAVVGTVAGLLAVAVAAGAVYLRRSKRQQAQREPSVDDDKDKASSLCELGSAPASLASGALAASPDPRPAAGPHSGSQEARLAGHPSGSGEMASTWMRTR